MDAQARNSIRHLTQVVERLMVRLQQAEARIEELSNRVPTQAPSDNDIWDAELQEVRKVGMSPALGAPHGPITPTEVLIDVETVGLDGVPNVHISYGPALNGTDLEDMYKRLGKEILENNKSDSDEDED